MEVSFRCQCGYDCELNPKVADLYHPTKELPFVEHKPNKCECTNDIRLYNRNGKNIWLCSCCHIPGDILVRH